MTRGRLIRLLAQWAVPVIVALAAAAGTGAALAPEAPVISIEFVGAAPAPAAAG